MGRNFCILSYGQLWAHHLDPGSGHIWVCLQGRRLLTQAVPVGQWPQHHVSCALQWDLPNESQPDSAATCWMEGLQ